ncbi:hypothetical protein DRE_07497 [Drechslerella stenobrocha 248]|uniref:Uncharacterized protein n=1 Tax=Drechslerella stenobrocha 248 TaxID=1043628 RepID=W7HTW9_9PEZI|nr:hypothetical protein DRE_07497 [Drechslerella stenobrocha 248]
MLGRNDTVVLIVILLLFFFILVAWFAFWARQNATVWFSRKTQLHRPALSLSPASPSIPPRLPPALLRNAVSTATTTTTTINPRHSTSQPATSPPPPPIHTRALARAPPTMALRSLVRFLLLTPIQVTIFLLISLPLAFLAATTTFFSVIFLSSRLLLVYVDLILNVLFTPAPASAPTPVATHAHSLGGVLRARVSPPLYIPRSPPRGGGASGASAPAVAVAPAMRRTALQIRTLRHRRQISAGSGWRMAGTRCR